MTFNSDSLIAKYCQPTTVDRLIDEVATANKRFNLFSRNLQPTDLRALVGESLVALELGLVDPESGPILDIGSGWGIPALPWLIALPELDLTFLERSPRKADFIALTLSRLGLTGRSAPSDLASFSAVESGSRFKLFSLRQVAIGKREIGQMRKLALPQANLLMINPPPDITLDYPTETIEYRMDDQPSKNIIKIALT